MSKQRIGYIGVGLMGHGAAKNILQKGCPLTIMGHHKRAPVDDLVALGSIAKGREAGKLRIEGKDYEVRDGDVITFRFNV